MTGPQLFIFSLPLLAVLSCSPDPLDVAKQQVKKKYQEEASALLLPVIAKDLHLVATSGPSVKIQMTGGALSFPQPDSIKETKQGRIQIARGPITALVITNPSKPAFDSLPASWGQGDIEKVHFICATSERDIDSAADADPLTDVVDRLTAKDTVMPLDSAKGLARIETETFTGSLAGDFDSTGRAELVFRPKQENAVYYRIVFRKDGEVTPGEFMKLLGGLSFSPES